MPSTRRRNAPCVRLGAIVLLCGLAAGAAAAQSSVPLTFDWPESLSGTATYSFERNQVQGGNVKRLSADGEILLTVSAVSNGLLLSFESGDSQMDSQGYPEMEGRITKMMARIMQAPPSYVVGRDGAFLRLVDPAGFAATAQDAAMALLSDLPPQLVQQLRQTLEATLSEAQLTSMAESSWNRHVGTWIGGDMEPGRAYHTDDTQHVPMLGAAFPVRLTYTLIGSAPCAGANGCVELEERSVMESPKATAAMETLFRRMLAPSGVTDVRVDTYRVVATSRVVADPDTLLTYRSTVDRETHIDVVANGQPIAMGDTDRRVFEFAYDN